MPIARSTKNCSADEFLKSKKVGTSTRIHRKIRYIFFEYSPTFETFIFFLKNTNHVNIKNIKSITLVDFVTYLQTETVCRRLLYRLGFLLIQKRCSSCRWYVDTSSCIEKKLCYKKNIRVQEQIYITANCRIEHSFY